MPFIAVTDSANRTQLINTSWIVAAVQEGDQVVIAVGVNGPDGRGETIRLKLTLSELAKLIESAERGRS
jgi:hypothetical protein